MINDWAQVTLNIDETGPDVDTDWTVERKPDYQFDLPDGDYVQVFRSPEHNMTVMCQCGYFPGEFYAEGLYTDEAVEKSWFMAMVPPGEDRENYFED